MKSSRGSNPALRKGGPVAVPDVPCLLALCVVRRNIGQPLIESVSAVRIEQPQSRQALKPLQ